MMKAPGSTERHSVKKQVLSICIVLVGALVLFGALGLLGREKEGSATDSSQCGVYLAQSTIPGAGIGIFAGKDYAGGETILEDMAIAISDIVRHNQGELGFFLWDEYTWNAESLNMEREGYNVHIASPGFGSVPNCIPALVNVDEGAPKAVDILDHHLHPGAGASTRYHHRESKAKVAITAGQELFVNYGRKWFESRSKELGPIPLKGDYDLGSELLEAHTKLKLPESVSSDLWNTFVSKTAFDQSRVLVGSFWGFSTNDVLQRFDGNLKEAKRAQSIRSMDNLKEIGACGDNLKVGRSKLPQAGLGAMASRPIASGSTVATLPMIHIPNRTAFDMYKFNGTNLLKPLDRSGSQLLLNYCFGHKTSTMLLCPYGPLSNYINHNQTLANVKLQWSKWPYFDNQERYLNFTVEQFKNLTTAKLSMELVATQAIAENEEVYLDYGIEWENAWNEHLDRWSPSAEVITADLLNRDLQPKTRLRTVFEGLSVAVTDSHDMPDLLCDTAFLTHADNWERHLRFGTLDDYLADLDEPKWPCEILRHNETENGEYRYTVHVFEKDDEGIIVESELLHAVPVDIFQYVDKPYRSNTFLEGVFRHDMRIPDELFPRAWRNIDVR